jgi:hypothetical protein
VTCGYGHSLAAVNVNAMGDPYDIYETLPSGDLVWRGGCADMAEVSARLTEFAKTSNNESYAKDKARRIVAQVNEAGVS